MAVSLHRPPDGGKPHLVAHEDDDYDPLMPGNYLDDPNWIRLDDPACGHVDSPRLIYVEEVGIWLRKSADWIYRNRERIGLPLFFVGGTLMADPADIRAWLQAQKEKEGVAS